MQLREMVVTTQFRLALETEEEREQDWNICQITQSTYLTVMSISRLPTFEMYSGFHTGYFFSVGGVSGETS